MEEWSAALPSIGAHFFWKKMFKTLNTSTSLKTVEKCTRIILLFVSRDIFSVQKKNGGSSTRARGRGDPRGSVLRKTTRRRNDDDDDDDEALFFERFDMRARVVVRCGGALFSFFLFRLFSDV